MKKNIYKILAVISVVGSTIAPHSIDFLEDLGIELQSVYAQNFSHRQVTHKTIGERDIRSIMYYADHYTDTIFSDGLMRIRIGDGFYFIDTNGNEVSINKPNSDEDIRYIGHFKDGKASCSVYSPYSTSNSGVCDKNGNIISYYKNTTLENYEPSIDDPLDQEMQMFQESGRDGLYGYRSKTTGEIIIPAIYADASVFNEGYAAVEYNGMAYVIKNPLIYCVSYEVLDIYTGEKGILLATENGKFGCVTSGGFELVPFEYDSIEVISDTKFIGYKGDEIYSIDTSSGTGQTRLLNSQYQKEHEAVVISEIENYDYVGKFYDGIAITERYEAVDEWFGKNTYYGAIDIYGNEIMPTIYDGASRFSEGYMAFGKNNDYYSYYDRTGANVIPNVATMVINSEDFGGYASPFKDGKALVADDTVGYSHMNYTYNFINQDGKKGNDYGNVNVHDKDFREYSDGVVLVDYPNGNYDSEFAYVDEEDNLILSSKDFDEDIEFKYKFSEGLVAVIKDNDKIGFVDKDGEVVIPFLYDIPEYTYYNFTNDYTFVEGVATVTKDGKVGCIDTKGREIIPFLYDSIKEFNNGYAIATVNDESVYIDKNGNRTRNIYGQGNIFDYEGIESLLLNNKGYSPVFSEGLIADAKDDLWGYIDINGELVIPYMYSSAGDFYDGHAQVTMGNKRFVIENPLNDEKYNIFMDKSIYSKFKTVDEYLNYLATTIDDLKSLNAHNISEIENYINEIVNQIDQVSVKIENNNIMILDETFDKTKEESSYLHEHLNEILGNYGKNYFSADLNEEIEKLASGIGNIINEKGELIKLNNISKYNILEMPNFNISEKEYSKINVKNAFSTLQDKLLELGDSSLNERGMSEVEKLIDYAFETLESETITAKNNTITLDLESQEEIFEKKVDFYQQFLNLISEYGVKLSENLDKSMEFVAKKVDIDKPVRIEIDKDLKRYFDKVDTIEITLDTKGTKLTIPTKDLDLIMENRDKLIVDVTYGNETLDLKFIEIDKVGNEIVIPEIEGKFYFSLPTLNKFSTVFSNIADNVLNWGGQFNQNSNTIEFATSFSGEYEIVEELVEINDIDEYSQELQDKIRYMVSKGFLGVDNNGMFYPENNLQRYHFVTILVRMFFEQDLNSVLNFDDVPEDSPYYHSVASGASKSIVQGYEDNTFRGETLITREALIALASRTLSEQKGYVYADEDIINDIILIFDDYKEISEWAKKDIALAIEYGLIDLENDLQPKAEITRAEAIDLLYNLFMLLYDGDSEVSNNTIDFTYYFAGGGLLFIILGLYLYKKNDGKNDENKEQSEQ